MDISKYDGKYVRIRDIYGESFSGRASYAGEEFLECEYGGDEDGIFIEDCLIYNTQIESIEEIVPHGTAEIWTENLILRRYQPDDAELLYDKFGTDPDMYKYSGWNPYATMEMAQETVQRFIDSYDDERSYSWVMDVDGVVVGTIGAYDFDGHQIEVGFSVSKDWQGRGFATEALTKILEYLTENEGIPCVTAWCAAENTGSRKVLEKSGMKLIRTEKGGLTVGDNKYDKLTFEYWRGEDPQTKESDCRLWAIKDPLLTEYHDHEWCRISHDDRHIFEMLCLEGQSTGLSWRTIINKRQAYKDAFFNFDIDKCAAMTDDYLYSLMDNTGLIRNKNKIFSVRKNAVAAKKIIDEFGSLDAYFWGYTGGEQIDGHWQTSAEMPTESEISRKMSHDLKKRGMAFVGPVITYSFMQAIGLVNDHLVDCRFRNHQER
ncbi:MAG: GNAT family N-acetyltransferase [Mogibacterium sp.]|nr:GNAT family N-acetyltransferase [Mogibacterium sp.]